MIEMEPTMSISKIVNWMKGYTTSHIWERDSNYLRKHFWKEHTFWTDGYFACSIGNVCQNHGAGEETRPTAGEGRPGRRQKGASQKPVTDCKQTPYIFIV